MKITTNGKRRELLTMADLTVSEREEFEYLGTEAEFDARFVRAYGNVYDVNDSQRITVSPGFESFGYNVKPDSPLASWHGIETESAFSATVFRMLSGDDDDGFVVVGYAYGA